jgi:hypothetical protein
VVGVDGSLIGSFFFHCIVILGVACEEEILYLTVLGNVVAWRTVD